MCVAEYEGAEFHHGDETAEILYLLVGVATIEDAGQVKELGTLIDFGPEALLESLFGGALGGDFFDEIKVGKDTDDFGEAVRLQDVEELKGFLL